MKDLERPRLTRVVRACRVLFHLGRVTCFGLILVFSFQLPRAAHYCPAQVRLEGNSSLPRCGGFEAVFLVRQGRRSNMNECGL